MPGTTPLCSRAMVVQALCGNGGARLGVLIQRSNLAAALLTTVLCVVYVAANW